MEHEDEQTVVAALRALAEETGRLEASPALEQSLLHAYRERRRRPRRRSNVWIPGAIAAGLALVAWLGLRPGPIQPLPGVGAALRFSPPVQNVPVARKAPPRVIQTVKRVPRKPAALEDGGLAEVATDFLPMHPALPPASGDVLQMVRISLPRTEMLRFGLPVAPGPRGARVKADVILGEDGIAQAIRFVR